MKKSPKKNNLNRNTEFLYEMGTIRYIQRTWRQFLTPEFQNLAEHHFRVIWIALMLAKMEGVQDTDKVMKMALFHDISESRTGDVNYLQRQYVIRNEELGAEDILSGTSLEDEFMTLWREYEARESIEAKIVKDADTLDVDFELEEQKVRGNHLLKAWSSQRKIMLQKQLYTKSARNLLAGLTTSSPHSWHENARNRFNSGDWKKKQANTLKNTSRK